MHDQVEIVRSHVQPNSKGSIHQNQKSKTNVPQNHEEHIRKQCDTREAFDTMYSVRKVKVVLNVLLDLAGGPKQNTDAWQWPRDIVAVLRNRCGQGLVDDPQGRSLASQVL